MAYFNLFAFGVMMFALGVDVMAARLGDHIKWFTWAWQAGLALINAWYVVQGLQA